MQLSSSVTRNRKAEYKTVSLDSICVFQLFMEVSSQYTKIIQFDFLVLKLNIEYDLSNPVPNFHPIIYAF